MVLLSKLTLPGNDKHGKPNKTPITQLSASQCIQWLNPRRQAHGLAMYNATASHKSPTVDQLRSEIVDAVQNGTYSQCVQYYVTHGVAADTVEFGYPHQTPLHYATAGGNLAMVEYLLANGGNLLAVDSNGNSMY
ncbi:hypothetical protein DYB30_011921 [Aphanomyces astaci]|uniref:Uncharacterized protein n=1 Tax=Aphanomyces astaci TaxID=112090 RepID=A0A397EGC7_APHAT|nr:hypothetical protein DYB34_004323 [Aphanomyces astaci]RHY79633.1 hypothetical protein DYB30_011921 [Aphanomyces astaci]RHZ07215.1 hypothetical protein DYB26_010277 [Aphanomyces astaci]